jgi:hypothetical protein
MDSKYLLQAIKQEGEIAIDLRTLQDVPEFKADKVRCSLESVALVAAGHSPIKDTRFDILVFEEWCIDNGLEYYSDEYKRVTHIREAQ